MHFSAFEVLAGISIAFLLLMLVLALFEPALRYKISSPLSVGIGSVDFVRMLASLSNAAVHTDNRIDVLTNGEVFYEAELEAIKAAKHSVNMEAYIFQKGRVASRFIDGLVDRAEAGVRVNLVIDAVGSFATWNSYIKRLRDAGAKVERYHPIRWYTLPRINNRTHRELLIVDGEVGFMGGAGIADHWLYGKGKAKRWRDTMFRVRGEAVTDWQSTFVENWLEASGEVLASPDYFPPGEAVGKAQVLIVDSTPSIGSSTRARLLFQTLFASARTSIYITTPYFLPDRGARQEIVKAIEERGVEVKILTPGKHADHLLTRTSSRRLYGELLKAGAEIYEYKPSMMHAKVMIVDGVWSVVGSTNLDNRSFALNDEVNLAALQPELAGRLQEDFARDLAESASVSYEEWKRRSLFERAHEWLGWVLERQQ